jgi:HK97 family phage prohead protease
MEKFIKVIRAEVKEVNEEKHTLTAVISTKKADRDGDIVDPLAFKSRLKTYKEHPVLLSSHNYSDLRKQIGKANKVSVEDNEVTAEFEYFVGQGNPEADWAWVLAQKGIASYSVGFIGHQFDWLKEKDADGNERITGRKFNDIELLEVSQVLIPSNRGALQMGLTMANEEKELCEMAIKSFESGDLKDFIIEPKTKETHYSDNLLGAEGKPISEPKEEIKIADITEAIKQAL